MQVEVGKYYLIYEYHECNNNKRLIAKCIGWNKSKTMHRLYLFEYINNVGGHNGNGREFHGTVGKKGHCWYQYAHDVIKKLSEDEAMAWLI